MTFKKITSALAVTASLLLAQNSHATGLIFLKDAPFAKFTEEDRKIFNDNLQTVLNEGKDGETREWSNPITHAEGKLTPKKTYEQNKMPCRTLSVSNKAKGRSATNELDFCKQAAGNWALAPKP